MIEAVWILGGARTPMSEWVGGKTGDGKPGGALKDVSAIGLGHPLGATGSRLIYTLAVEMDERKAARGIASACIGGGQGIAVLLERI